MTRAELNKHLRSTDPAVRGAAQKYGEYSGRLPTPDRPYFRPNAEAAARQADLLRYLTTGRCNRVETIIFAEAMLGR